MKTTKLSLCFILAGALGACGDDDKPNADADAGGGDPAVAAVAAFAPPQPGAGAEWGAIPFPSDLLLDEQGMLTLTSVPGGPDANPAAETMLMEALHTLDGAPVTSHAYFPITGEVDADTLAGNVKLVDLDADLAELPIELSYRSEIGAIQAMPIRGTLLAENHRYAAFVTTGVKSSTGVALSRSPAFTAALDLSSTPSEPAIAAAQESLRPLLEALDSATVESLAVATVFRTAHTTRGFKDMYDVAVEHPSSLTDAPLITFGPAAAELDFVFGGPQDPDAPPGADDTDPRAQPHSHVSVVLHGVIEGPSFRNADPLQAGFMERDADGKPVIKGMQPIPFTITLPAGKSSYANLPVLLWVHGINRTRADMLMLTDPVNEQGYAYLGIDLMYHGNRRATPVDRRVNVIEGRQTCAPEQPYCDGFGDDSGVLPATQIFHLSTSGGIPPYHPRAMMENLRQSAIDLIAVNNFLQRGDLSRINAKLAELGLPNDLSFVGDDVGILTESFGAMPALLTASVDSRVKVAFLASPASSFPFPLLFHSPGFSSAFSSAILTPLDLRSRTELGDPVRGGIHEPALMLWNGAIEQGDPLAFARALMQGVYREPIDLLVSETWQDEWVTNDSLEHLIGVMNLPVLHISRSVEPPGPLFRFVPELEEQEGPIQGNIAGGTKTAAASLWYPAAHALLRKLEDYYVYEPNFPPFVEREEIWYFCNPVENIHAFWSGFFAQHYRGEVPAATDPFPQPVPPGSPPCAPMP